MERLDAFSKFIETHSWASPLVQTMVLAMAAVLVLHPVTLTVYLLDVAPTQLLSLLPNLRSWRMEVTEFQCGFQDPPILLSPRRAALSCYERHAGHIQNLELSRIFFHSPAEFQALVSAFTGIRSLSCSYIWFEKRAEGVGANTLTQSHRLKCLHVGAFVDIYVVEYLLGWSLDTLENLVMSMSGHPPRRNFFERLGESMNRLSRIASLTLLIPCTQLNLPEDHDMDKSMLYVIQRATRTLQCVPRTRTGVRIEFELHRIACLGRCLSWGGALPDACSALEDMLLTFPLCRIVLNHAVADRYTRMRRAGFWFLSVKRAFPKLDERGLLTWTRPQSDDSDALGHEMPPCLIASPDSKMIVTASVDGTIIVWDVARGTIAQELLAHQGSVDSLALSPDGTRVISSDGVGSEALTVWDIANGGVHKVPAPKGHTRPVTTCAWSPDGALIASASADGTVRVWDAQTLQQRDLIDDPRSVAQPRRLQFSPDSRYLAWISSSPTDGHTCSVWRPLTGEQPRTLPSHLGRIQEGHVDISAFSFDPASRRIATAHGYSHDRASREFNVVRVWDLETGAALAVLAGHAGAVVGLEFSPEGASLLSVSSDSVRVWNAESAEEIS